MSEETCLGIRPGDLDGRPYAKYWNPEMGPMQEHVQHMVVHCGMEMNHLASFLPNLYADYH